MSKRIEHDFIGDLEIADDVYYGVQTFRALQNFVISNDKLSNHANYVKAFAQVKKAAAKANCELGVLDKNIADNICKACDLIISGKYHDQFVVDMFQGGAGTSSNMNANEVIANIALELMGHKKGEYKYCHPNDHVNLSQSTNDAYPTAIKLATYVEINTLLEKMEYLQDAFESKACEFKDVLKMGRTQLQDAVPMTLGQEFKAYENTLKADIAILKDAQKLMTVINMGGTAIGTGINSHPDYPKTVEKYMREVTGINFTIAHDLIAATPDCGDYVQVSSALKRISVKLSKTCNDLRLLSSGPRCGLNEINLPKMQPGSSIMPGKVNPVIPEVVNQVCYAVIGHDVTISFAAEGGQLELNVFEPVIAYSLFNSISMLQNAMVTLADKCVKNITANELICKDFVYGSIGIVTALNPYIGYENSASIAKEALNTGKKVYDLALERGLLTKEQLDELFKAENMLHPHMSAEDKAKFRH